MSDTKPGDQPAFSGLGYGAQSGLTKREYFAAAALQGVLAANTCVKNPKIIAGWAVEQADALLAALEGKHE